MTPLVSVVLPTYNCPHYVGAAIQSILDQTFADFELIVIDDGSSDETPEVVRSYADPRLLFFNQANQGLAATLNRGIGLAQGRYIARQDQDDISAPERFRKQVAYLEAHPSCALVGTWAEIWKERAPTGREHRHPSDNSTLKFELLFNNPFVHSSVMIRKSALDQIGSYSIDQGRQPPEDYELWSRIARRYDVANIPEALHIYREIGGSMSRAGNSPFMNHLVTISSENIAWASATDPADSQVGNISALVHGAEHRLEGRPNFKAMGSILERALSRVVSEEERPRFLHTARARIDALKSRHREIRRNSGWRRHVMHAARCLRRLIRGR